MLATYNRKMPGFMYIYFFFIFTDTYVCGLLFCELSSTVFEYSNVLCSHYIGKLTATDHMFYSSLWMLVFTRNADQTHTLTGHHSEVVPFADE